MSCFDEYKKKIRTFILKYIQNNSFTDDEHLFQRGYINSLMAIELILFIETEFSMQIGNEDLNLDNFKSVEALARLVERKKAGNAI
jgi:acyl carrier protein